MKINRFNRPSSVASLGNSESEDYEMETYSENVNVTIESLVLENQFTVINRDIQLSKSRLVVQGIDSQYKIAELTAPIDEAGLNISDISYRVLGEQHEFYHIEINAEDRLERVRPVYRHFGTNKLQYRQIPKSVCHFPTEAMQTPWLQSLVLAV